MESNQMPILFPYDPKQYWEDVRAIIREEIQKVEKTTVNHPTFESPGLTYKPLYKMAEICQLFQITRPTVYDWVKHGKLKPFKIRSRVFFLWNDVQQLMKVDENGNVGNK